jgi:SWI/SNF-related matrix-associated actin-dependent regulator of chromatin subfamily B protein 1
LIDINLDFFTQRKRLRDDFLWDISNPDNIPEDFAQHYAEENDLPSSCVSLISL